jgi:hypothetical protein
VDALTELGVIRATGDRLSVRRAIAYFLDNLTRQLEREETLGVGRPAGRCLLAVACVIVLLRGGGGGGVLRLLAQVSCVQCGCGAESNL